MCARGGFGVAGTVLQEQLLDRSVVHLDVFAPSKRYTGIGRRERGGGAVMGRDGETERERVFFR